MSTAPASEPVSQPLQCLAIPGAARRGWREDVLCASLASTEVEFHGRPIAVCRMHEATYARWGETAEANAAELWEWTPEPGAA
jgi:hypothetical protein